jgi:hypothetical protein
MPPTPPTPNPVRSAAVINAEIRALARRARWTPEELALYVRLVAEERAAKAVEEATLAA